MVQDLVRDIKSTQAVLPAVSPEGLISFIIVPQRMQVSISSNLFRKPTGFKKKAVHILILPRLGRFHMLNLHFLKKDANIAKRLHLLEALHLSAFPSSQSLSFQLQVRSLDTKCFSSPRV